MDANHWIGDPPTGTVYIGYERGTWPLVAFSDGNHAAAWLGKGGSGVRYLWRYQLTGPVAMEHVPEVRIPATLEEKETPNATTTR